MTAAFCWPKTLRVLWIGQDCPASGVDQTFSPFETALPLAGDTLGCIIHSACVYARAIAAPAAAGAGSSSWKTSPADMVHPDMAPCRRVTQTGLTSCSRLLRMYLHNHHQASSATSAPQKRPRFIREEGVVAAKVGSVAV